MRRGADLSRSIDYHVFAGAEFISTEIFEVFAERIFELTKDVYGFVIRGDNGLRAEIADSIF